MSRFTIHDSRPFCNLLQFGSYQTAHEKTSSAEKSNIKKRVTSVPKAVLLFALICLLAAQGRAVAQQQRDKAAQIDDVMKTYQFYRQFNGSVLVAEGGKVVLKKGYGMANMEWNVANEADTK